VHIDEGPEYDPPEFVGNVGPPPVQDQAAELDAPADTGTSQFPCPVCGRIFKRVQERNRHVQSFLPHWIHCPYPRSSCPRRFDRRDNLVSHWKDKHADGGQAPQKHQQPQFQIYDPGPLVRSIVSGQTSMVTAENAALLEVARRAQELGKGNVWGGDWWGRRRRPHTDVP